MKILIAIVALSCIVGCGGTGVSDSGGSTRKDQAEDLKVKIETATMALKTGVGAEVIASSNQFGFRLMSLLAESKPNENLFISPLSISLALSMTYNGARGETAEAMAKALGTHKMAVENLDASYKSILFLLQSSDPKVETIVANSIWTRLGIDFNPEFLQKNQAIFSAQIETLDFQNESAIKTINNWVMQKTNGKITSIISTIPDNAVMYLMNAIYFKGMWHEPFKESNTHETDFYLDNGTQVKVEMMQTNQSVRYYKGDTFSAVALPYGSKRISMMIVLPNAKLAATLESINEKNFTQFISSMKTMEGNISIPKWKSESEYTLNEVLSSMGMSIAFEPEKADFSGISTDAQLFLQKVLHKTYIEVNEEGTEAAAATGVEVGATAMPETFDFIANQPFIYFIMDNETKMIIFSGIFRKP